MFEREREAKGLRWRSIPITRNIKRRPLFTVSLSRRNSLTEKERLYESREVYRHGRACRHHFRCGEECGGQAAHGMRAGNQSSHDSGVHSRTAWNAGGDLGRRNLGDLVTRSAKASCQPAGGVRSAQERAAAGWQPELSSSCPVASPAGGTRSAD